MSTIHIDEAGQAAEFHDVVQSVSITHLLQQRDAVLERLAQAAHHQCLIEFFLLGESGDIDSLKTRQRLTRVFEIVGDGLVRKIAQPIVVAIVSYLSGKFRLRAQRVLPLNGEQAIEFGASRVECLLGCLGKERDDKS